MKTTAKQRALAAAIGRELADAVRQGKEARRREVFLSTIHTWRVSMPRRRVWTPPVPPKEPPC